MLSAPQTIRIREEKRQGEVIGIIICIGLFVVKGAPSCQNHMRGNRYSGYGSVVGQVESVEYVYIRMEVR